MFKSDEKITIQLPKPATIGSMSVEETIANRRSSRRYKDESITLAELGQLLWAGHGITSPHGFRTVPSAGALYPLELYVVVSNVSDLTAGVYKYQPKEHRLEQVIDGDKKSELCKTCRMQPCVNSAAANIVICAVYERTTKKYGPSSIKFTDAEVGCVYENMHLQAVALNLGTVYVGGFEPETVREEICCATDEEPVCVMPIGKI
jgi:SagB-type dehydrogenase family enzyme